MEQGRHRAPSGASSAGEVFAPYKSTQYEAGVVKVERGGTIATVSAFRITKPGGQMSARRLFHRQRQKQRNRGLEFGLHGEAAAGARPLASATVLDARLTRTGSAGTQGLKDRATGALPAASQSWRRMGCRVRAGPDAPSGSLVYTGPRACGPGQYAAHSAVDPRGSRQGARYRTTLARRRDPPCGLMSATSSTSATRAAVDDVLGATVAIGEPRTLLLSATMRF
ncbi:TonB-dependent receptor domain-containing protein [Cupriavidus basilensis]